jgi:hypothetical protein
MSQQQQLFAAIASLFVEVAELHACDTTAADSDQDGSQQLLGFLAETVQNSNSDDAFNVFACYFPEYALADLWPRFWQSVGCYSLPSPTVVPHHKRQEGPTELNHRNIDLLCSQDLVVSDSSDTASVSSAGPADSRCVALLRLDHMRRPKPYTDLICSWAQLLNITGFLLFSGNLILIFLSAETPAAIARYLQLHRTQTVDVDSHGRPCREKMLTVLLQQQQQQQQLKQHMKRQDASLQTGNQEQQFRVLHAATLPAAVEILTTQTSGAISRETLKSIGFKL